MRPSVLNVMERNLTLYQAVDDGTPSKRAKCKEHYCLMANDQVTAAITKIAHEVFLEGENQIISILEQTLSHQLHPDFAMDRVIRATISELVAELKDQAPILAQKVYPYVAVSKEASSN